MSESVAFSDMVPTSIIHVSAGAAAGGDGSSDHPYATIQAAVNVAKPGTAIYVHAGTYVESVKIPHTASGTADAPIWLVSADGPQAARIVGANDDKPVIQALGVDNYVIKNFDVSGGYDGIQFSQSGQDFTNFVNNVVIQGNVVSGAAHDGIKVGQANNAYILDNVVHDIGAEEGIDVLGVQNGVISRNEIYNLHNTTAAIFAKGGSTDITISDNYIHDVTGDGISAGGVTGDTWMLPGATYEAKDVEVRGNKIVNVGKQPVSVRGAIDVEITGNYLASNSQKPWAVYVTTGYREAETVHYSSDVTITGNTTVGARSDTRIDAGNNNNIVATGNGPIAWEGDVGPDPVELWTTVPVPPAPTPWAESQAWTNSFVGTSGADSLTGTAGADYVNGATGTDTMTGGAGDDTYVASGASDVVVEDASAGIDTVWLYDARYQLGDNVENLIARTGSAMTLFGNGLANMLIGGAGADTIVGAGGSDFMTGGAGADVFMVLTDGSGQVSDFASGDRIVLAGDDFASFAELSASLSQSGSNTVLRFKGGHTLTLKDVTAANLTAADFDFDSLVTTIVAGGATTATFTGTSKFDVISGTAANDRIDGRGGADLMKGGAGDDTYLLDNAGDRILEFGSGGVDTALIGASRYVLDAQVENATITTSSGATVVGNASANWIIGGSGADYIEGGGGFDLLTGGGGADTFVFHGLSDAVDVITDFTAGGDKLDLSSLHADHEAGTWSTTASTDGLQVYFDYDGGHHLIATLDQVTSLSGGDIIF